MTRESILGTGGAMAVWLVLAGASLSDRELAQEVIQHVITPCVSAIYDAVPAEARARMTLNEFMGAIETEAPGVLADVVQEGIDRARGKHKVDRLALYAVAQHECMKGIDAW